jgi:RNA polymerase sigma-70 factor (ECF subfamily)
LITDAVASGQTASTEVELRFEQIYVEHFAFVWRMTRRLGVADASVDDVVQDVFVVLHRRLAEYDGRASVRGWLFGILSHVVREHRRRYERKEAKLVPTSDEIPCGDPTPAAIAERSERIALLAKLLDALDDGKREILVLAYLEQMTVPEIAELLDLNLNTAYSRLRAAKQAFDELHEDEMRRSP